MALFNRELNRVRIDVDCLKCPHYDPKKKECTGLGIACYEIDLATNTLIDPVSGLPIKLKEENENGDI